MSDPPYLEKQFLKKLFGIVGIILFALCSPIVVLYYSLNKNKQDADSIEWYNYYKKFNTFSFAVQLISLAISFFIGSFLYFVSKKIQLI